MLISYHLTELLNTWILQNCQRSSACGILHPKGIICYRVFATLFFFHLIRFFLPLLILELYCENIFHSSLFHRIKGIARLRTPHLLFLCLGSQEFQRETSNISGFASTTGKYNRNWMEKVKHMHTYTHTICHIHTCTQAYTYTHMHTHEQRNSVKIHLWNERILILLLLKILESSLEKIHTKNLSAKARTNYIGT